MSRLVHRWATITIAGLLSACSVTTTAGSGYPIGVDPTMRTDRSQAPTVMLDPNELPAPLATRQLVDLGWDAMPQEAAGVFVGLGRASDKALRISAVTSDGTILWTTQRPLSCTGFALSSDRDRPLAVLTDLAPGQTSVAVSTATAYDLLTGERVWGPVELPGSHAGPGLVFAALPTGGAMGSSGVRVALDPTTGDVAATEQDLDGARLVGEYHGTLLIASGGQLIAHEAHDNAERWRLPLTDLGVAASARVMAAPDSTPGHGHAFVGDRDAGYALIDLADGTVLTRAAHDTATDASVDVHITVDGDRLTGQKADGRHLWDQPVEPGTRIASAGDGTLYR